MDKQKSIPRGAGVLMPVFSLPSECSIGTFGSQAYRFIDFMSDAGLKYWQVLPLVPADESGSPYRSCSAFAGSPLYISPELLEEEGLIEYKPKKHESETVCYEKANEEIDKYLRSAYKKFSKGKNYDFELFCIKNAFWLNDYAEFTAIKAHFGGKPWYHWEKDIKYRDPEALGIMKDELKNEIMYHKFCQYEFYRQWHRLKSYAAKKNIKIIGDIPIYVAYDSADVWANPSLFQLDETLAPKSVAGVPPDMFSETGQLWGNPLYNWNVIEKQDFAWWKKRISHNADMYDVIRIDHFIGIINYYAVPYGEINAVNGTWIKGPGMQLIKAINESRGESLIIAEDLGIVTPEVRKILKKSGYAGMKLMEFAFDGDAENENLPHNFKRNCVVYGGTHDNETLAGYFSHTKAKCTGLAKLYLGVSKRSDIPWGIIRSAFESVASLAVFQMQDYLSLDNSSRINTPSTTENNWLFRFDKQHFSDEIARKIHRLIKISGR